MEPPPYRRSLLTKLKVVADSRKSRIINPQTTSPLFQLPREIREYIWESTLAPSPGANNAHFHVYDDLYDCCTYLDPRSEEGKTQALRREYPTQMSLLLTCRIIYREALHYLWQTTTFSLVILAGRPRPIINLVKRSRLGSLEACHTLLQRIRRLELIVQPGRRPNTTFYNLRVTKILRILNYGERLTHLRLYFNFHRRTTLEREKALTKPFHQLHHTLTPRLARKQILVDLKSRATTLYTLPLPLLDLGILGLPGSHFTFDPIDEPLTEPRTPRQACLQRGVYGAFEHYAEEVKARNRAPRSPAERRVDLAAMCTVAVVLIVSSPVSLPILGVGYCFVKRAKGEW